MCPLSPHPFNTMLSVLATAVREEKEIKVIRTRKEEVTVSLFACTMILYIGYLKHSIKIELITNFSEVVEYKIKSLAFLYNNDKQTKNKIRETTPFPLATHTK